jgi:hypothetical protein
MTPSHKKPGVAFWATVGLVVVLVAYPLSFGPACWLTSQSADGDYTARDCAWGMIAYWPLGRIALSTSPVGTAMKWWTALGLRPGNAALVPTSMKRDLLIVR